MENSDPGGFNFCSEEENPAPGGSCIFCEEGFSEENKKSNAPLFPKYWWGNETQREGLQVEGCLNLKELSIGEVCTICAETWIKELNEHVEPIVAKVYNTGENDINLPATESSIFIRFLLKSYFARMSHEPESRRHYPYEIIRKLKNLYYVPHGVLLSLGVYLEPMKDIEFVQYDAWLTLPGMLIVQPQERRLKFAFRFNRFVFGLVWLDLSNPIYLISAGFINPISGIMCRFSKADLPINEILPNEMSRMCSMLININCIGNTKSTAMDDAWVNEMTDRHTQLAGFPLKPLSTKEMIDNIKSGIMASEIEIKKGARLDYYMRMIDSDKLSSRDKLLILNEIIRIEVGISSLAAEPKWKALIEKTINNDSYFPASASSNTPGRDFGFEIYIAGRFSKSGFIVDPLEPDLKCTKGDIQFGVAIKRVRSRSQLIRRIKDASQQILRSGVNGVIVVDFSPLIDGYYEKLVMPKLIDPMTKIRELQLELSRQVDGLGKYCNEFVAGIIGFSVVNVDMVVEINGREIRSASEACHGDFASTTEECKRIWVVCRDLFLPPQSDPKL